MSKTLYYLWTFLFICFGLGNSLEAIVWLLPAQSISSPISSNPQIGIDASGNAVAIWQQFDGLNTNIQSADLPKGGSWTLPTTISSAAGNNIEENQIAINASGYAVAVWTEPNGGNFELKSSTRQFGGSWSTPLTITTSTVVNTPQVAIDASGNAIAVWQDTPARILSSSLPFGSSSWFAPLQVSPVPENAGLPRVGVDASGNAVAIWLNQTGLIFSMEAATLPFGGFGWSAAVTISNLSDNVNIPALAVNPSGFAVAAWTGFNGVDFLIQAATLPSIISGAWTPSQDVSSGPTALQADPAVDLFGNAILVWSQINADSIITSSYLPFGSSSWQTPLNISSPGLFSFDPQVAFDALGNAIAVWDSNNLSFTIIQAATLPPGGSAWSTPTDLSDPSENSSFPQVAVDPSGYAVIDWQNDTLTVIQATAGIPPPTVTNVNPNNGPTDGGNTVIITGTNFINVTSVMFGSNNALSFIVLSPTSISAVVPPGLVGIVDVRVTTSAGTSPITPNDQYTYLPGPTVIKVKPNIGPPSGGNTVKITGTNFINVIEVKFGSKSALSFTVLSPTTISAVVPSGSAGSTVDVRVTTSGGTSPITPDDRYTYQPRPKVINVNPNNGPPCGGNTVIITGKNFIKVKAVNFGLISALSFTVLSPTIIRAIVPSGCAGSTVDVRVTTSVGTSPVTPNDHYTYENPPLPPSEFIGMIKENKFLNKTEFILKAEWKPSSSSNVVLYRIYEKDKIVKEISVDSSSSSSSLCFVKRLQSSQSALCYSITAVDSNHLESCHVKLRIIHHQH